MSQINAGDTRKQREKEKKEMLYAIYQNKHQAVIEQKKQREMNEVKKKVFTDKFIQKNVEKSQKIREEKDQTIQKKKEMEAQKVLQNKLNYEKRKAEEEALKMKKEQEILEMKKLELELIQKLHETQEVQKTAYEELESALNDSPSKFAEKYYSEHSNSRSKSNSSRGDLSPLNNRFDEADQIKGDDQIHEKDVQSDTKVIEEER